MNQIARYAVAGCIGGAIGASSVAIFSFVKRKWAERKEFKEFQDHPEDFFESDGGEMHLEMDPVRYFSMDTDGDRPLDNVKRPSTISAINYNKLVSNAGYSPESFAGNDALSRMRRISKEEYFEASESHSGTYFTNDGVLAGWDDSLEMIDDTDPCAVYVSLEHMRKPEATGIIFFDDLDGAAYQVLYSNDDYAETYNEWRSTVEYEAYIGGPQDDIPLEE